MTDRSKVISPPGDTAWVYDPVHNEIDFVSKTTGSLYTYDLTHETFTRKISLGGAPGGIAVTADGRYLIVGNSPGIPSGSAFVDFTRVDQSSGGIDQITLATRTNGGAGSFATLPNDIVLVVGPGGPPDYLSFDASAATPVQQVVGSLQVRLDFFTEVKGDAMLTSPDHRYVLLEEMGAGPSRLYLYDALSDGVIGYLDRDHTVSGAQAWRGDVSNAGMVLDIDHDATLVFDKHLNLIKDLTHVSQSPMFGGAFSQDGKELFLWSADAKLVLEYDTQSWALIGQTSTITGGGALHYFDPVPASGARLVDHGTMLALDDGVHGVELIDLTAKFGIVAGDASGSVSPTSPPPEFPLAPDHWPPGGYSIVGDMDSAQLSDLLRATITAADDTRFVASGPGGLSISLQGYQLTYANNQLVGGLIGGVDFTDVQHGATTLHFSITGGLWPAAQFETWLVTNDTATAFKTLLNNDSVIIAGPGADVIHAYGGKDLVMGAGGSDTLWGGDGDDAIYAAAPAGRSVTVGPAGSTYLRGEDGNDFMVGGGGFDDMNGNAGRDTLGGGDGNDWVVGGKDNDLLFGEAGSDIVYGNMGDDTCVGGAGDDTVRGGQANDILYGGDGNDWLSGDRGDDTISGGAGADTYYIFAGSGLDRITDFNRAEGDRVQVDPGAHYAVSQQGADTVVDLGGGDRMVLVGVQASSLGSGWIVGA